MPARVRSTKAAAPALALLDAIRDPHLFRPWFKDPATWQAWFAFLAALFALRMTDEQLAIFQKHTGRDAVPRDAASEAWLICGRRAGKSFMLALVAVFLACFRSYSQYLAPGERGTVLVIATDRKQARVILRYVRALLTQVAMLKPLVEREWAEGFDLTTGVTIEVASASFRSVRGYTLVAALLDEMAFWPTDEESAAPDYEILNAIRPGMATIPGAMLLCASSPYARRGALYEAHKQHYGKDGPVLVWQAATRDMNPRVPQSVIDAAYQKDPANAAAEFGAQFRTDIEGFLTREAVDACVSDGIRERAPEPDLNYTAFADPSGGSSDSFTLAIGHKDKQTELGVLDCIRERKSPFAPSQVVLEFAAVLKSYNVSKVIGDRYAGEWPREQFKAHGITYEPSAKPKSDLYRDFLPLVNSRKLDLLDNPRLTSQLVTLERRTARSGKDSIDHAPGAHDDVANAVAGVLTNINASRYNYDCSLDWVQHLVGTSEEWQRAQLAAHMMTGARRW